MGVPSGPEGEQDPPWEALPERLSGVQERQWGRGEGEMGRSSDPPPPSLCLLSPWRQQELQDGSS